MEFIKTYLSDSQATQSWDDDHRQAFQFGVANLPAKQELVLKSMIRLLDSKLDHKWFHSTGDMDLCITSDGLPASSHEAFKNADGQRAHLLELGFYQQARVDFLVLPLRVDELFLALNRIGKLLHRNKAVAAEVKPPTAHEIISVSHDTDMTLQQNMAFRLTRWPPFRLVDTLERTRMATLLTAQALKLSELQLKSGYPLLTCEAFVDALAKAGLLGTLQTSGEITQASGNAPLVQPTASLPPAPSPVPLRRIAAVKPGLLNKIRHRLGLGGSVQT